MDNGFLPRPVAGLVPAFRKDSTVDHEYLWWYHGGHRAIRVGDWKLVSKEKDGAWELYNLSRDRTETTDLAAKFPEKVRELEQAWAKHLSEFSVLAAQDSPSENDTKKPARKKSASLEKP